MPKVYPDQTVENAARAAGLVVTCLWQLKGPPHTAIAWMECLSIGHGLCIIQTFEGGGWNALTSTPSNSIAETVADVIARCTPDTGEGAPVNLLTAMNDANLRDLADDLETGVASDIWYDAADYGGDSADDPDRVAENRIETTQSAMTKAAAVLRLFADAPGTPAPAAVTESA